MERSSQLKTDAGFTTGRSSQLKTDAGFTTERSSQINDTYNRNGDYHER
jgi:hypothetical protein